MVTMGQPSDTLYSPDRLLNRTASRRQPGSLCELFCLRLVFSASLLWLCFKVEPGFLLRVSMCPQWHLNEPGECNRGHKEWLQVHRLEERRFRTLFKWIGT